MRFSLRSFLLPSSAALLLLATGCDKQEINAQAQAGAWHIDRVSTQYGLDPASTTTVTDAGDVSFAAYADNSLGSQAVFYFDKAVPSTYFQTITRTGKVELYYTPENNERHRVILTYVRSSQADLVAVYTLTEDQPDRQRWQLIGLDNQDRINYREEWELSRQ